jgi:hypothetical protein
LAIVNVLSLTKLLKYNVRVPRLALKSKSNNTGPPTVLVCVDVNVLVIVDEIVEVEVEVAVVVKVLVDVVEAVDVEVDVAVEDSVEVAVVETVLVSEVVRVVVKVEVREDVTVVVVVVSATTEAAGSASVPRMAAKLLPFKSSAKAEAMVKNSVSKVRKLGTSAAWIVIMSETFNSIDKTRFESKYSIAGNPVKVILSAEEFEAF